MSRRRIGRTARRRRARKPTSRRTQNRWLVFIAIGAILVVVTSRTLGGNSDGDVASPSGAAPAPTVEYHPIPDAHLVEVARIIDGDTLVVRDRGDEVTVRLFGVDAPERGEACYREATDRLEQLSGTHVQLLVSDRLTDRFGRLLRYVYTADGQFVDELLVAEGFGFAWPQDGEYRDQIVAVEGTARSERQGCIWAR